MVLQKFPPFAFSFSICWVNSHFGRKSKENVDWFLEKRHSGFNTFDCWLKQHLEYVCSDTGNLCQLKQRTTRHVKADRWYIEYCFKVQKSFPWQLWSDRVGACYWIPSWLALSCQTYHINVPWNRSIFFNARESIPHKNTGIFPLTIRY